MQEPIDYYQIEDLEQAEDLQRQGYFSDQTVYNLAKLCYNKRMERNKGKDNDNRNIHKNT